MASTLTAPKAKGKDKKMGTAIVNPQPKLVEVKTEQAKAAQLDPNKFVGRVTKKEDNPFTGTKILYEGEYSVDLASKFENPQDGLRVALGQVGGNLKDVLFWYDHGRKVAARTQATLDLGLEFTSDLEDEAAAKKEVDDLEDLYSSFTNALNNMVNKDTPKEKRKRVIDFILGEDKFEPIRGKLSDIQNPDAKFTDFAVTEIKKPSGIKGKRRKVDAEASESEGTEETES